jgi:hypothetical protein
MKIGRKIPLAIGIMLIFGVILTTSSVTLNSVEGQSPQEEASQSIRGAITETGEFVGNASEKVATSETAGTLVNETSEVLGNATVETQKFFSPNSN